MIDTFSIASDMGSESLSAYIISMARNPSDVLAVELLKREARFLVSASGSASAPTGEDAVICIVVPVPGFAGSDLISHTRSRAGWRSTWACTIFYKSRLESWAVTVLVGILSNAFV